MARPIKSNPILRGEAAREFLRYIAEAKPDPKKAEQNRKAVELYRRVNRLPSDWQGRILDNNVSTSEM